MKGLRIVAVCLLCLALIVSVACAGGGEEASRQEVEVKRGDLSVTVSGSGNLDVSNEKNLAFGAGGKIDKIYIDEGDKVSEGEVLATLDTDTLELALTQAKTGQVQAEAAILQAKAAQAQATAARNDMEYNLDQLKKVLRASHERIKLAESYLAAAEEQVKAAESQIAAAESQLEAAKQAVTETQRQLDETSITAPFDGLVANVSAKEGDIVPPPSMGAKTIIHLIDTATMELNAEVDEIDIADVELGQRAIIEVDALPVLQLEGKVISISLLPEMVGGVVVYEVEIGLDISPDSMLKVGMSATADIVINERNNILLVPDRAIGEGPDGPTVKVTVGEDTEETQERPVVIGISDGFDTEIVSGIEEGEVVVVERRGKS
ncbi:efflux RND transporter periplasmic adaptor subunit [Chloroflexota bacterium]